jgi:putative ABC transport system substrate-binding protein
MRRREFITLLGGAAAALPLSVRAQQPAMPLVGYLSTGTPQTDAEPYLIPFRQGLNALGYIEDRNVTIEYRWAEFKNERLRELAADLIGRSVAVIATIWWHAARTCGQGDDINHSDHFLQRHRSC